MKERKDCPYCTGQFEEANGDWSEHIRERHRYDPFTPEQKKSEKELRADVEFKQIMKDSMDWARENPDGTGNPGMKKVISLLEEILERMPSKKEPQEHGVCYGDAWHEGRCYPCTRTPGHKGRCTNINFA